MAGTASSAFDEPTTDEERALPFPSGDADRANAGHLALGGGDFGTSTGQDLPQTHESYFYHELGSDMPLVGSTNAWTAYQGVWKPVGPNEVLGGTLPYNMADNLQPGADGMPADPSNAGGTGLPPLYPQGPATSAHDYHDGGGGDGGGGSGGERYPLDPYHHQTYPTEPASGAGSHSLELYHGHGEANGSEDHTSQGGSMLQYPTYVVPAGHDGLPPTKVTHLTPKMGPTRTPGASPHLGPSQAASSTLISTPGRGRGSPRNSPRETASAKRPRSAMAVSSCQDGAVGAAVFIPMLPAPIMPAGAPMSPVPRPIPAGTIESGGMRPSPQLKPLMRDKDKLRISADTYAEALATRSNYDTVRSGSLEMLGYTENSDVVLGVGQRRQSHKTAEQKRRDYQKLAFDAVRTLLPDTDRNASKIDILRKAHEHICNLQRRIRHLETQFRLSPTVPPTSPPAFVPDKASPLTTPLSTPIQRPLPSNLASVETDASAAGDRLVSSPLSGPG